MVYSQSDYSDSSTRPSSSETVDKCVLERTPCFTLDQCCVRGTWVSLVIECFPFLYTLPSASSFWEIPHRALFIPEQCFWPISSYLSYWEQLKKSICKCEHPVRLDRVLNSWPFFPLLWEPSWLYRMNGIFQTNGTCESKGSSIKKKKCTPCQNVLQRQNYLLNLRIPLLLLPTSLPHPLFGKRRRWVVIAVSHFGFSSEHCHRQCWRSLSPLHKSVCWNLILMCWYLEVEPLVSD